MEPKLVITIPHQNYHKLGVASILGQVHFWGRVSFFSEQSDSSLDLHLCKFNSNEKIHLYKYK